VSGPGHPVAGARRRGSLDVAVGRAADRYTLICDEATNVLATAPGGDRSAVCGRFSKGVLGGSGVPLLQKQ
jgi:hypothetical protein